MKVYYKKVLCLIAILTLPGSARGYDLSIKVHKSPVGPGVAITMPSKSASDMIRGIELPLAETTYETSNKVNFHGQKMVRIITKAVAYLYRVYKAPNVLGRQGTWLTNLRFKNRQEAMKSLALLPEWYKATGEPDTVALIRLPKGTEIYVGNAAPQRGASQPSSEQKRAAPLKRILKKKQKTGASTPKQEEIRDFRLGGGSQIFVPFKNFMGHTQLTLSDVVEEFPLQKPALP